MDSNSLKILEEFGDDIQRVCDEVIRLRDETEDLESTIKKLEEEIYNHECK